ncbi:MAG: esterase [Anaerolineae bacterium]|nr:esterase [Anaerolineae bacterium]MCI0609440.1 esterase [Anaerolineae bacterium]
MTKKIHTIKGSVEIDSLGLILPHEHLFTDLRGPLVVGYAQAEPEGVVWVVGPFLADAFAAGATALVECSTVGVGRNISILQNLAEVSPIHIIAPTGVYRDAFIPPWLREINEADLAKLWIDELTEGIEGTSIRAGFIKLAMSDDGPTALEIRNLRAAVKASQITGAVIASHTIGGRVTNEEMDVLEEAGLDLHRFIWIHAQTESNIDVLKEAAQRGAFVELDSVGAPHQSQKDLIETVVALIEAGYIDQILLSHDAGWYNPANSDGLPNEGFRGYTALTKEFLPALSARGISEELVRHITVHNPARAFAF